MSNNVRYRYLHNKKNQIIACLSTYQRDEEIYFGIARQNPKLGTDRRLMREISYGRAVKAFEEAISASPKLPYAEVHADVVNIHVTGLRGVVFTKDIKTLIDYFQNQEYRQYDLNASEPDFGF